MVSCRSSQAQYPVYTTLISGVNVANVHGYRPTFQSSLPSFAETLFQSKAREEACQTVFRENDTQTEPFNPEVRTPHQSGFEVFTLTYLSWNNGLPAGMREAIAIERARQKRAWQAALPIPFNTAAREIQNMILEAMELNEWNHRETELAALSSIRLDLARLCMRKNLAINKVKYEDRMLKYVSVKVEETRAALGKVRHRLKRNLRRLAYRHSNVNRRYHRCNVIQDLEDKTSEFYGPQRRFGVHPRRAHEVIHKQFRFWNLFSFGDVLSLTVEDSIPEIKASGFDYVNKSKPRQHLKQLCWRDTRWTLHELEKLHLAAKIHRYNLRKKQVKKNCSLRKRIEHAEYKGTIPAVNQVTDEEENAFLTAVVLQKIIKGRAIQTVMFEGRLRCQELIDELKSTHALQTYMEDVRRDTRQAVYTQQRNEQMKALEEKRKSEILQSLQGKTVADILDFLSKELVRIRYERETHAIALMADRERNDKEAAEAGRRQKEIERVRELEEMWRQISKVYQNSLDSVSERTATGMRKNFSENEARREATEYAKRVDAAASEAHQRENQLEEEEIVADLVYNFALPETEREMVRSRLRSKQKKLLSSCHDEIYSQMEAAVRGKRSPSGSLLPLPRPKQQKSERTNYVTYVELNKAGDSFVSSDGNTGSYASASLTDYRTLEDVWSTGFTPKEVPIKESDLRL